jgi:hypothetical protein
VKIEPIEPEIIFALCLLPCIMSFILTFPTLQSSRNCKSVTGEEQ